MGILNFFRKRKVEETTEPELKKDLPQVINDDKQINNILEEEIKNFFPEKGVWYSNCFELPKDICYENLPCHLRDNDWMSKLLHQNLIDKNIYIPKQTIKNFVDSSVNFANLRHEYELRIVKWQINYIKKGGSYWLAPKGLDEFSLMFSEDVDKIIRAGVVKTLKAINMDIEVIEEGLEKYAEIWRPYAMSASFCHIYEPLQLLVGTPPKADDDHKKNWLANREYEYYQRHKNSVDKYGTKTPAMEMTNEEHSKIISILEKQNELRSKFIENWTTKSIHHTMKNTDEDVL